MNIKWLLVLAALSLASQALYARDVTISVMDGDLDIPLEGATIRSWDGTEYFCDEEGNALISLPDDRQAAVQIAYPGYETRRILIGPEEDALTASLRLSGVMESRELVLEARRPDVSETKIGRSVAISDRELARTSEIGIVEDVMTSVKLLPGVGYTSMFNARPSIRGGDPGDMIASLDGFYINEPYHWGGAFSIFDPRMVQSARLSHGVFSSRYGRTISGLLEITSKSPSRSHTELDVGVSSSATDLALSHPLGNRGGIKAMGRVTYWDPFIWAVQGLSQATEDETLEAVEAITTAPYIRSATLSGEFQPHQELSLALNGFFGSDGVGLTYDTNYDEEDISGSMSIDGDYHNYLGFLNARSIWSFLPRAALRGSVGFGFRQMNAEGKIQDELTAAYSDEFKDKYGWLLGDEEEYTTPDSDLSAESVNTILDFQHRLDFDWELGNGFIAAFGLQQFYTQWRLYERAELFLESRVADLPPGIFPNAPIALLPEASVIYPFKETIDVFNQGITNAAYALGEYQSPNRFFGAELGLRMDHLFFIGKDFTIQTYPVLNPRLNLDFTLLRDFGAVDNLSLTAGTGLFSSINETIIFMEKRSNIEDFDLKSNRSSTSVLGLKLDLLQGYSLSLEGYGKYIFDRAYLALDLDPQTSENPEAALGYRFDGDGMIFGFDLQLQKLESRYWDGWLTYTFTYARYREPIEDTWYYPSFHRFHNINLVLNIKPTKRINIGARLGFASGRPKAKTGEISFYPVQQVDEYGQPTGQVIQRYRRESYYDDNERTTWSIPLDVKVSFFTYSRKNKVQMEIYGAVENLLSLVYQSEGNTTYNTYTGKEDKGSDSAVYEMPIPMVSFGVKWSF